MEKYIKSFLSDMGMDSFEDIAPLYKDYINECSSIFDTINNSLSSFSKNDLLKLLHNLKGISANLYVENVHIGTKKIHDNLIRETNFEDNIPYYKSSCNELFKVFSDASQEIYTFFNNHNCSIRD